MCEARSGASPKPLPPEQHEILAHLRPAYVNSVKRSHFSSGFWTGASLMMTIQGLALMIISHDADVGVIHRLSERFYPVFRCVLLISLWFTFFGLNLYIFQRSGIPHHSILSTRPTVTHQHVLKLANVVVVIVMGCFFFYGERGETKEATRAGWTTVPMARHRGGPHPTRSTASVSAAARHRGGGDDPPQRLIPPASVSATARHRGGGEDPPNASSLHRVGAHNRPALTEGGGRSHPLPTPSPLRSPAAMSLISPASLGFVPEWVWPLVAVTLPAGMVIGGARVLLVEIGAVLCSPFSEVQVRRGRGGPGGGLQVYHSTLHSSSSTEPSSLMVS